MSSTWFTVGSFVRLSDGCESEVFEMRFHDNKADPSQDITWLRIKHTEKPGCINWRTERDVPYTWVNAADVERIERPQSP